VPFQYPGPPNQVVGEERWAEPGSLEDSCPSNALALPTEVEAQWWWAKPGILEDSCPSDALAHPTKIETQKGGLSRVVWTTRALPRCRRKKGGLSWVAWRTCALPMP
jgi:hypothetical protein